MSEGMDRRIFRGWLHFLLPGSTPSTFPWKPARLQVGALALPSPLPPLPSQKAHVAHKEGQSFSTPLYEVCCALLGG